MFIPPSNEILSSMFLSNGWFSCFFCLGILLYAQLFENEEEVLLFFLPHFQEWIPCFYDSRTYSHQRQHLVLPQYSEF